MSDEKLIQAEEHMVTMASFALSQSSTQGMLSWICGDEIMILQGQDLAMSPHLRSLSKGHKSVHYRNGKEAKVDGVE